MPADLKNHQGKLSWSQALLQGFGRGARGNVEADVEEPGSRRKGYYSIRSAIDHSYHQLGPIAASFHLPAPPSTAEVHANPIVLVVGNHSSGKSSFINHLLGRDVQKASQAPWDDKFTVFMHHQQYKHSSPSRSSSFSASSYVEQSGEGLALNQNLPFQSLSEVKGKNFLHRVTVKLVAQECLEEVMLVDSPGMMDGDGQERDYDMEQAMKWFAARATQIFFFFDPDKPGTSSESLRIFSMLSEQYDFKLSVILSKVDVCGNVNDLARTYGTLCWNLAKVISGKDMPIIYTSHLPDRDALSQFTNSLPELQRQVLDAPSRHVDTLITQFQRYVRRLSMSTRVLHALRKQVVGEWWKVFVVSSAVVSLTLGSLVWWITEGRLDLMIAVISLCVLMGALVASIWCRYSQQRAVLRVEEVFRHEYYQELRESREHYERMWHGAKESVIHCLQTRPLLHLPKLSGSQQHTLSNLGEHQVQLLLDQLRDTILRHDP